MFYAFLIICLSGSALAQLPSRGKCPHVEGLVDVDINKFTGRWYEVARYFALFEITGKCNVVYYDPGENGTIDLVNAHFSRVTETIVPVRVKLLPDVENPSVFHCHLPFTPYDKLSSCSFLGTDYDSYAVTYCCTDYGVTNLKYAWAMTRDRFPKESVMKKIYNVFDKNNLPKDKLWKTDQNDCPSNTFSNY